MSLNFGTNSARTKSARRDWRVGKVYRATDTRLPFKTRRRPLQRQGFPAHDVGGNIYANFLRRSLREHVL
jgi:hypothetical protein